MDARAAVEANSAWYHTIELAPGVATPGMVDHRPVADRVLPADLTGVRALDVGTYDGFWAFELERRGAEVVAIDSEQIDMNEWPPIARERLEREHREAGVELGLGFRLAAEQLGSGVRRQALDVYDLSPATLQGGPVDLVFAGAILLHLRDPVRALEGMRSVLRPGGRLISMEPFSLGATLLSPRQPVMRFYAHNATMRWWFPNLRGLQAWMVAAGFAEVRRLGFVSPPARPEMRQRYCVLEARTGASDSSP
jgi:SAM-dependent methyltransferase